MAEKPRRVPRPSLRRRISDPFSSDDDRTNFPGFEAAFLSTDVDVEKTPKIGSASKKRSQHEENKSASLSSDRDTSPFMLDRSIGTHSSSPPESSGPDSSSSMDMSIGARAAMAEHLRYIAKYGLDGENVGQEATSNQSRDRAWDRLMDGNASVASWSTAHTNDSYGQGVSFMAPVFTVQADGNESIEIVTDLNVSDFFNSSRVHCLETPEKNKHQKHSATVRATERHPLFPSFDEVSHTKSECNTSDHASIQSGMMHLYKAAMGFVSSHPIQLQDTSFSSSIVDVSRITASFDDDFPSSSLDSSFQGKSVDDGNDIRDLIPPIARTPSRKFRDSSCTPRRSSPRRRTLFSPNRSSPTRVGSMRPPLSMDKENSFPNLASLALSPIAAMAGSEAGRILREGKYPNDGTPFLDAGSPIKKCATPSSRFSRDGSNNGLNGSPVSRSPSLGSGSSGGIFGTASEQSSVNSRYRARGDDSCNSRHNETSDDRSSPQSKDDIQNHRRKFRTVVPSRVFLSRDEEIPFQDDSFSTPSGGAGTTSSTNTQSDEDDLLQDTSRRSLLKSFEAALHNDPLPEIL